jgi:hypothetical protein
MPQREDAKTRLLTADERRLIVDAFEAPVAKRAGA